MVFGKVSVVFAGASLGCIQALRIGDDANSVSMSLASSPWRVGDFVQVRTRTSAPQSEHCGKIGQIVDASMLRNNGAEASARWYANFQNRIGKYAIQQWQYNDQSRQYEPQKHFFFKQNNSRDLVTASVLVKQKEKKLDKEAAARRRAASFDLNPSADPQVFSKDQQVVIKDFNPAIFGLPAEYSRMNGCTATVIEHMTDVMDEDFKAAKQILCQKFLHDPKSKFRSCMALKFVRVEFLQWPGKTAAVPVIFLRPQ